MSLVYATVTFLKVVTCHLHVFSCSIDFLKGISIVLPPRSKIRNKCKGVPKSCCFVWEWKITKIWFDNRWALFYYKEYLINCWSWPLDRAQLGQIFNDQIFLPEMAVCGRCHWKAQAAQVQGNGKLGGCRQWQRRFQYFAQVLQQE